MFGSNSDQESIAKFKALIKVTTDKPTKKANKKTSSKPKMKTKKA